jgi:hypothetical protein
LIKGIKPYPFMKNSLILVVLIFSAAFVFAHPNGHGNNSPETSRTWKFQDKSFAAEGTFYFFKEDRVYIHTKQNKVISFALNELSWMDNDFVNRRVKDIEQLNFVKPLLVTPSYEMQNQPFPWTSILLAMLGCLLAASWYCVYKFDFQLSFLKPSMAIAAVAWLIVFPVACAKDTTATTLTSSATTKNDPTVMAAAFVPYKSFVTTRFDATYFYIDTPTGLPAHNMMVGITNWQQQVPVPQAYTGSNAWSIPLTSTVATTLLSTKSNFMKGAIAIAANGIPIFNPLNNRGEDSYLIGELDNWGGHCGKADDYHYHVPPIHLSTTSGNLPIAYALDGYAVYGAKEADGSTMTTLDDFHGHSASDGTYHYHGTTTYPYMIATMRGKVTSDPATTAPENQILPQASAKPIRPPLTPLNGAKIITFSAPSATSYSLEYQVNSKSGFVNYNWVGTKYNFTFIDTNGTTTMQSY